MDLTRVVRGPRALPRWAIASLVANIGIVVTGGLVRLTGSGLGCPTWPRCTDDSFVAHPELGMYGAIEFGNRLLTFVLIVVAVLTFVPWGGDGLSLDLMRRGHESENGTVEFVVVGVAEQARELGVRRISLNFAVFRSVFERGARIGAGPVLRLWHRLLLLASRRWQIESLYRANAKYQPEWLPRFVCFRRAGELPRVAFAALHAEAFVHPRLRRLAR